MYMRNTLTKRILNCGGTCSSPLSTTQAIHGKASISAINIALRGYSSDKKLKKSEVKGAKRVKGPFDTLASLLSTQADELTNHDAFISKYQDIKWTYEELQRHTLGIACGFNDARIKKGMNLLHMTGNDAEHVVCHLAAGPSGYIFFPLDPLIDEDALRTNLAERRARGVTFPPQYPIAGRNNYDLLYNIFPELHYWAFGIPLNLKGYKNLKAVIHTGWERYQGMLTFRDMKTYDPTPNPLPEGIKGNDVLVGYTSADGKDATAFTNESITQTAFTFAQVAGIQAQDRICITAPLHVPGTYTTGVVSGLGAGSTMLSPGMSFDAESVLTTIATTKCCTLHTTTHQLQTLVEHPTLSKFDISCLKKIIIAETPDDEVDGSERKAVGDVAKSKLEVDTIFTTFSTREAQAIFVGGGGDTLGTVLPGVEAKLVDDKNNVVPVGTKGRLKVKGANVMAGYLEEGNNIAGRVYKGDWVSTSAHLTMNPDGSFF